MARRIPDLHVVGEVSEAHTRWLGSDSILFATSHRPWPPPMTPWLMTQRWNDLLFLHYTIAPEVLRRFVPDALALDTYDHRAWVSVVPFWMDHVRVHGSPRVPFVSHFPELNVRTYVTYEGKPGVYFFSLDAGSLSAVWGARVFYRLPYWKASMKVNGKGRPQLDYRSKREHGPKPATVRARYGPTSPPSSAMHGSIEHFLSERYCLYSTTGNRVYRANIHHLPWPLQDADYEIEENSMAKAAGLQLPEKPELANFSRELKVLVWAPERLA